MWWNDENHPIRKRSGRPESPTNHLSGRGKERTKPPSDSRPPDTTGSEKSPKLYRKSLLSESELAANRALREAEADRDAEFKLLLRDIQTLENAVKLQSKRRAEIEADFDMLQCETESQLNSNLQLTQKLADQLRISDAQAKQREGWLRESAEQCNQLSRLIDGNERVLLANNEELASQIRRLRHVQTELHSRGRAQFDALHKSEQRSALRHLLVTQLQLELRKQTAKHKDEIEKLRRTHTQQNNKTISELYQARNQAISQNAKIASLQQQLCILQRRQQESDQDQSEQDESGPHPAALPNPLQSNESDVARLQAKVDCLADELDCYISEAHHATCRLEDVSAQMDAARASHAAEIESLRSQLGHAKSSAQSHEDAANQQRSRAERLQATTDQLRAKTEQLEDNAAQLQANTDQLKADAAQLKANATQLKASADLFQVDADRAIKQRDALVQSHEQQVAELWASLDAKDQELQASRTESEQQSIHLNEATAVLTEIIDRQSAKLLSAEQETRRLSLHRSRRIAFLARERQQLSEQVGQLKDELNELSHQISRRAA